MTEDEYPNFPQVVWSAIERAELDLSSVEREALEELLEQGETTLLLDLEGGSLDETFDPRRTADELVERIMRGRTEPAPPVRELASDSIREWICPLYPIC